MKIKCCYKDYLLWFGAIGSSIGSAWLSYHTGDGQWFQRSGCLTVLFSAWLETRQLMKIQRANEYVSSQSHIQLYGGRTIPPNPIDTSREKKQAFWALVTIIYGTVIWGYGDLLFKTAET